MFVPIEANFLRTYKGYESFPELTFYGPESASFWHISPGCVPGKVKVIQGNFLDYRIRPDCKSCQGSDAWDLVDWIYANGSTISSIVEILQSVNLLKEAISEKSITLTRVGHFCDELQVNLQWDLKELEGCVKFLPTLDCLRDEVESATCFLKDFLCSDEGLKLFAPEFLLSAGRTWSSEYNALFYTSLYLEGKALAVATVFGVKLASDRFIARGPEHVLKYLKEHTNSTPLTLGDSVSDEVLTTAATLWDPAGRTVLEDGMAALEAAKILL